MMDSSAATCRLSKDITANSRLGHCNTDVASNNSKLQLCGDRLDSNIPSTVMNLSGDTQLAIDAFCRTCEAENVDTTTLEQSERTRVNQLSATAEDTKVNIEALTNDGDIAVDNEDATTVDVEPSQALEENHSEMTKSSESNEQKGSVTDSRKDDPSSKFMGQGNYGFEYVTWAAATQLR